MNIKKIVLSTMLLSMAFIGKSQYVSHISTPDKSKPKIESTSDDSYRLANAISSTNLENYLKILASDSLQGRETGTEGSTLAADYISGFLKKLGMEGRRDNDAYFQQVSFTFSRWTDTDLFIHGERYRLLWDYIALPEQNEHKEIIRASDIIFLGYGIDDPKYSDYKKVDVKDKVIMINRGEPWNNKKDVSYITGTKDVSDWSKDIDKKLRVAKEKGVKLVLIIDEDFKKTVEDNRRNLMMPNLQLGDKGNDPILIANNVFISTTIAKALIGENEKKMLKAREKMAAGKPNHVVLPTDFAINMSKKVTVLKDKNIVGTIRGKSKPNEFIVISAHYDHLGKRGDEVFNGADDNGSGSSAVMELARAFKLATYEGKSPERSIVFLWFTGEEKGLLGSQYYTTSPLFPLENTVANINIDMIGRTDAKYQEDPNYVYVIGSDRLSSELHEITEDVNQKYTQLTLDYGYNSEEDPNRFYYRSDHYNFAEKGIPAIFFFDGIHEDYHRPSDTVEKINFDEMTQRTKLIFHLAWELANRPEKIKVDKAAK
ncbi:MAG: M28 family peptidase [Chitinophagales bacterium]|nr:M28 family peptidase [Chitinophagales bacterium]